MKKAFFTLICSIFFLNLTQASTSAYEKEISNDSMFSKYDQKRSRWCNVMSSSKCADPAGFQKYLDHGCINDADRESKCLKTFCMKNCASLEGCPTGELNRLCQDHCTKVNLENAAAQTRLNACVQDSYNSDVAAAKSARRDYYREKGRYLMKGQNAALKEAQKVLDLVNNLSKQRRALFYVDGASLSKAGIVQISDFIPNIQQAIELTTRMNKAVKDLERSGQSEEILKQAKALMAKSDRNVEGVVQTVQQLSEYIRKLNEVRSQGSRAGRPVPRPRPPSSYSTDSAFSEAGSSE